MRGFSLQLPLPDIVKYRSPILHVKILACEFTALYWIFRFGNSSFINPHMLLVEFVFNKPLFIKKPIFLILPLSYASSNLTTFSLEIVHVDM